ncbi:hypothetical protein FMM75_00260 [Lachnospiraceae bacterium MD335]|nr:hypothetical protein [Lachnospiraceae bacterium MD335]
MDQAALVAMLGAYLIFILVIGVVCWVLYGISHMKALKAVGYDKAWMAWIPLANMWALAEVALDGDESMTLFGSLNIPAIAFKLWWVVGFVSSFIPMVGGFLNLVLTVICLGTCYIKMYAKLDGRDEKDVQALGYVSGFFPIIAVFKFLFGKYN